VALDKGRTRAPAVDVRQTPVRQGFRRRGVGVPAISRSAVGGGAGLLGCASA